MSKYFKMVQLEFVATLIKLQIKKIDLILFNLDHDCGQFIAKSIRNDGELNLSGCEITKTGYEAFSVLLGDKQIKKIELRSIHLDHVYGQFIAKSISNDGELRLFECKTTQPGYEAFNVELGDKQIRKIHLRSIDLDHVWGQFIAKSISNDGELRLLHCKITKPGYEAFSVVLGDKQVKEINISGIQIHDDFTRIVLKSISNDGNLKLSNCRISKPALKEFRVALKDKLIVSELVVENDANEARKLNKSCCDIS